MNLGSSTARSHCPACRVRWYEEAVPNSHRSEAENAGIQSRDASAAQSLAGYESRQHAEAASERRGAVRPIDLAAAW